MSLIFEDDVPLVSIFLPTYNHKVFIAECLESCIAQDYPNIQIVVGDDGSDDGTDEVAREFQARYPNKIIFTRFDVNQGITANANQVLDLCTGEFIAFTSGDDILFPNKLSRQVAFMQANPRVVICYHDVECYEQVSGKVIYKYSDRFPMAVGSLSHLVRAKVFFAGNSVMMRRRSAPPNGFDTRIRHSSDWLFFMEALMKEGAPQQGIAFVPEILGRYRRHSGNKTGQTYEYGLPEALKTLDIAAKRAPAYRTLVRRAMAERLLTQSVKDFLKGRPATALGHFSQGIATSPFFGPLLFASNLTHYLNYRIIAFCNRRRR
ncbi:MAG: glycosyltransferase [Alphaproteobacteria bacterium]|nr:glycosyltransferase [Alphaproteobacteria bacterium]